MKRHAVRGWAMALLLVGVLLLSPIICEALARPLDDLLCAYICA